MPIGNAKRVKGVSFIRGIVYGNSSQRLPTKKNHVEGVDHTHRWTVSLRGVNNEDISFFIKKVQFRLHETYANPLRTVEKQPFEVTETGWGEFEIIIKIYFVGEKSVTVHHMLKLHPFENDGTGQPWPVTKPVTSYHYDEVVFNEPTESMHQLLLQNQSSAVLPAKKIGSNTFTIQSEEEEYEKIESCRKKVSEEITTHREKIRAMEEELASLRAETDKKH